MGRVRDPVTRVLASGPQCYEELLADSLVSDWISVYRSVNTRDEYLRSLNTVCVRSGFSPRQLLDLRPDEARKVVMNIVQGYLKKDKLVAARKIQTALKNFFEYHDRAIKFKRIDKVRYVRKKIAYEVIPTKDQVYRMADVFKELGELRLRSRAVILCLFQSGVRVNCLLNWRVGMVQDQLYPEIKVPVRLKITNVVDTKLSGHYVFSGYAFNEVSIRV